MDLDTEILKEILDKASLFDEKKKELIGEIEKQFESAEEELKAVESKILSSIDKAFKFNLFAEFLGEINSGKKPTNDEIKSILSQEIPVNVGSDGDSFKILINEIKSLWWKWESMLNPSKFVPGKLAEREKETTSESITVAWKNTKSDLYEIEVESPLFGKRNCYSIAPKHIIWGLNSDTEYSVRVRSVFLHDVSGFSWCEPIKVRTKPKFSDSKWKECPGYVNESKKYVVDKKNPRTATKAFSADISSYGTIIGSVAIPLNTTTSWSIKVLKSKNNNGDKIYVGVAPFGIDQNKTNNYNECGWYFNCYDSALYSGHPHDYRRKEYGPRKGDGEYVHSGDSVSVVMDTRKGELSFVLNGVNLGVAYKGIPLDKPLVPCVILCNKNDSIKLVI